MRAVRQRIKARLLTELVCADALTVVLVRFDEADAFGEIAIAERIA